jgi:hypothetical protein
MGRGKMLLTPREIAEEVAEPILIIALIGIFGAIPVIVITVVIFLLL